MPEDLTLANLFSVSGSGFTTSAQTVLQASAAMNSLKNALAEKASLLQFPWLIQQIRGKLPSVFDIKLIDDVLVLAWKKYFLLAKYSDTRKYSPTDTFLVPLAEHSLKHQQHPYLEIKVGDRPAAKIVFDVTLSFKLKGFVVKVQNARLKAIQTGTCEGKGSIALEEAVLAEKAFSPVPLPGSIDLGEGIAIND